MRTVKSETLAGLVSLGAVLLGACAAPAPVNSTPVDVLSPEERRLQAVESKLALMQRRLDSVNTLRFDDENARLREDLRSQRGDVEKARNDLQVMDRRLKDLYQDLDRRLQQMESRAATPAASPASTYGAPAVAAPVPVYNAQAYAPPAAAVNQAPIAPAPAPVVSAPKPAPAPVAAVPAISQDLASPEEEGAYLTSFDLLKTGKYDDAVRGFRGVLDKWPNGRYADKAAYWMGEASYVKRDYNAALAAFQTVVNSYPSSVKAADAALRSGLIQIDLKQTDAARATLQQVVRKYPNTSAAQNAQQKLNSLGGSSAAPTPDAGRDSPRR